MMKPQVVSPSLGGNGDGVDSASVTLSFANGGLAAGTSQATTRRSLRSDIDGRVTGASVTVTFSDGTQSSGKIVNQGDTDDPDPDLRIAKLGRLPN